MGERFAPPFASLVFSGLAGAYSVAAAGMCSRLRAVKRAEKKRSKARSQTLHRTRSGDVIIVLLMSLVPSLSRFSRRIFDVGDTNKACYGLHNIVFEIIINFKRKEFHLNEKEDWRADPNNGISNRFS
jgi:hypothetical protein